MSDAECPIHQRDVCKPETKLYFLLALLLKLIELLNDFSPRFSIAATYEDGQKQVIQAPVEVSDTNAARTSKLHPSFLSYFNFDH